MNPVMVGVFAAAAIFTFVIALNRVIQTVDTFVSDNPGVVLVMVVAGLLLVSWRFWR